jgi:hypothetical protein
MYEYDVDRRRSEHNYRIARLEKVANQERLLRGSQMYQRKLYQQALAKAGDWLIAAGTTLKERQSPMNTNWQQTV